MTLSFNFCSPTLKTVAKSDNLQPKSLVCPTSFATTLLLFHWSPSNRLVFHHTFLNNNQYILYNFTFLYENNTL